MTPAEEEELLEYEKELRLKFQRDMEVFVVQVHDSVRNLTFLEKLFIPINYYFPF